MTATPLLKTHVTDLRNIAVQAQQLQDNSGNAVDMTELTGLSGLAANLAAITASAATINAAAKTQGGSTTVVATASTIAVTAAMAGGVIDLGTASGTVATLPNATGTGNEYTFVVTLGVTSNYHEVLTGRAADCFVGQLLGETGGTVTAWPSAFATTNIAIQLDKAHKGGALGDFVKVRDIATNTWLITGGNLIQTASSPVTPFSTTA